MPFIDKRDFFCYAINVRSFDMTNGKTRYHLDKHYVSNPLRFGDVQLLQIGRRYCEPTEIISPHPHLDWFELTIVTGGQGVVVTGGESTRVFAGDIYLSFPCDVHEIRASSDSKLEYDFFSFSCDDVSLKEDLKQITRMHRGGESRIFQDENISYLVKIAISELSQKGQPYAESVLSDVFRLIVVYLIRDFKNAKQPPSNVSEADVLCFQVMNYIDTHIYSLQRLERVALKFNYNYSYLSKLFKKTTGKTLLEYYQHRKMEIAKALILEKKKTIGTIAELLGYNLYSFSKAFKAYYGVSPKSLQKQESSIQPAL